MDGIGSKLLVQHQGTVNNEVLNDQGGITILEAKGHYLPEVTVWLFSPQSFLEEHDTELTKPCPQS